MCLALSPVTNDVGTSHRTAASLSVVELAGNHITV
jgi:hypothetical protein